MDGRAPRVAVPLAAALLGFLAVLAASQPEQPLRETRRLELADLIREEDARVERLRAQVGALERSLEELAQASGGGDLADVTGRVEALEVAAGVAPLDGPGVVVRLDDSATARSPSGDPNDLLVHERDIQTVVNALWSAGAEAVAVAGQRLTGLSAVRCTGNTLLLHGRVHVPPYVIAAIGNPRRLAAALSSQPGMDRLLAAVETFGIRLTIEPGSVRILGGGSPTVLRVASPEPKDVS
jgi:uncharacterized protein YlxW (UPF0749 family)